MAKTKESKVVKARTGRKLKYPLTVVRLLKQVGDAVNQKENLFEYTTTSENEVGDFLAGETWMEKVTTAAYWPSPHEGSITEWRIKQGDVLKQDSFCVDIDEPCAHTVQYQGMCAICGKDMTELNWAQEDKDSSRATINKAHAQTDLFITTGEAVREEEDLQRRLLQNKKLSLVVDLDQTVIHACCDSTVADWQNDPTAPNHDAVKDVEKFQLADDPRQANNGIWYFIKMRPGLKDFLHHVSQLYELHIYTMGTRAYAQNVAHIIDPERKLFGDRIISRDESGSMRAKSLQRLFPVDTRMVVIIDDRSDVWPYNPANLIKVTPYDFFVGIGDINSSFLPKLVPTARKTEDMSPQTSVQVESSEVTHSENEPPVDAGANDDSSKNGEHAESASSASKPILTSGLLALGENSPAVLELQAEEQKELIERQVTERPLLSMQRQLDEAENTAEATKSESDPSVSSPPSPASPPRHNLLRDDDSELIYLDMHLTRLHKTFFENYGMAKANAEDEDSETLDGELIPDIGDVLKQVKSQVLAGTRIVLSGLVPLGIAVKRSDIGRQCQSFGVQIQTTVTRDVTHIVVPHARSHTRKVRLARSKYPHIKIINHDWLLDTFSKWSRQEEEPYLIKFDMPISTTETDGVDSGDEESLSTYESDSELKGLSDTDLGSAPPPLRKEDSSPIDNMESFDWGSADKELDEFLASGDDDSDNESTTSNTTSTSTAEDPTLTLPRSTSAPVHRSKRSAGEIADPDEDDLADLSHIAKKKKLAVTRATGLSQVAAANSVLAAAHVAVRDTSNLDGAIGGTVESQTAGSSAAVMDDIDGLPAEGRLTNAIEHINGRGNRLGNETGGSRGADGNQKKDLTTDGNDDGESIADDDDLADLEAELREAEEEEQRVEHERNGAV